MVKRKTPEAVQETTQEAPQPVSEVVEDSIPTEPENTLVEAVGKPVVQYSYLLSCIVGKAALVTSIDHPSDLVTNGQVHSTSTVLSYDKETGEFETENTLYVKQK